MLYREGQVHILSKGEPVQAATEAAPATPPRLGSEPRPGSAKRVFIALSSLHTAETVEYKRLLRELHIGHTSGMEKHV